jgi:hypothetical protein
VKGSRSAVDRSKPNGNGLKVKLPPISPLITFYRDAGDLHYFFSSRDSFSAFFMLWRSEIENAEVENCSFASGRVHLTLLALLLLSCLEVFSFLLVARPTQLWLWQEQLTFPRQPRRFEVRHCIKLIARPSQSGWRTSSRLACSARSVGEVTRRMFPLPRPMTNPP